MLNSMLLVQGLMFYMKVSDKEVKVLKRAGSQRMLDL